VLNTDTSKMAAIGYCFGGMAVLEMVRDGQNDLAGVVSFHGVLAMSTPLKPNTFQGKILVLHGVDDPVVPDDQTMAFWKECAMPMQIGSSSPTARRSTRSPTG
jgi:dienelactone hydrolase